MTNFSQMDMETWFLKMTKPTSRYCAKGIGAKLMPTVVSCDFQNKTVVLAYKAMEWQLNPHKIMHGGLTATAIYFTMELLCGYFANTQKITLVSADTAYQKPIFAKDTYYVTAQLTGYGNTILQVRSEAISREVLASSATATYAITQAEDSRKVVPL